MTQNTSSAVMQRRSEAHDSLDDFPTPPWATRALCEYIQNPWDETLGLTENKLAPSTGHLSVREPAANRGHMVRPLQEYFARVEASDIHDYGAVFPPAVTDKTERHPWCWRFWLTTTAIDGREAADRRFGFHPNHGRTV